MKYEYLEPALVMTMHSYGEPTDREWAKYLEFLAPHIAKNTAEHAKVRVLVVGDAGGPNAAQRRRMTELPGAVHTPTVVVTRQRLARGVVTALTWIGVKNIRAVAPEALDEAFAHLKVSTETQAIVRARIEEMRQRGSARMS